MHPLIPLHPRIFISLFICPSLWLFSWGVPLPWSFILILRIIEPFISSVKTMASSLPYKCCRIILMYFFPFSLTVQSPILYLESRFLVGKKLFNWYEPFMELLYLGLTLVTRPSWSTMFLFFLFSRISFTPLFIF